MDLKLLILIAAACLCVSAQWDCKTYLGSKGLCIPLSACEPLKILAQKRHKENLETLKKYICGFNGRDPNVCCPNVLDETMSGDACITPDGDKGTCRELKDCDYMKQQILESEFVWEDAKEFMKWSRCSNTGSGENTVCCKQSATERPTMSPFIDGADAFNRNKGCVLTAFPPNPDSKCCGIETNSEVRIIGGNITEIDQFPWLAKLGYTREEISCGGSLISGRYVLTAAHCLVRSKNKTTGLVSVTLGEFNTSNSGPDCVETAGGGTDCTDGELTIGVESVIVHEGYNPDQVYRYNDIALIRLKRTVNYTDFIRPICLPTFDFTVSPPSNLDLFVAGWGIYDDSRRASTLKLYGKLPYVGKQRCDSMFSAYTTPTLIGSQICVGGEANKDTCQGDSGGPLMYLNDTRYDVTGIISYGVATCGMDRWPSIYTKVYDYLDWIRGNIQP